MTLVFIYVIIATLLMTFVSYKYGRISEIADFIRKNLRKLEKDSLIFNSKYSTVNSSEMSVELINRLLFSLESKQQQDINQRESELKELSKKVNDYQEREENLKRHFKSEVRRILKENDDLRSENEHVKNIINDFGDENTITSSANLVNSIHNKQLNLEQILNTFENVQYLQNEVSKEFDTLKGEVNEFKRGKEELVRKIKKECDQKVKSLSDGCKKYIKKYCDSRSTIYGEELDSIREEQKRMKAIAKSVLESIQSMQPDKKLNVTPDNFYEFPEEIMTYICGAVQLHQEKAVHNANREILDAFPEVADMVIDTSQIISRILEQNIEDKEREYKNLIQKQKEKENKLKEQLRDAIEKIRQYQYSSSDLYEINDTFIDDDWERSKAILDKKMSELTKIRSDSFI